MPGFPLDIKRRMLRLQAKLRDPRWRSEDSRLLMDIVISDEIRTAGAGALKDWGRGTGRTVRNTKEYEAFTDIVRYKLRRVTPARDEIVPPAMESYTESGAASYAFEVVHHARRCDERWLDTTHRMLSTDEGRAFVARQLLAARRQLGVEA